VKNETNIIIIHLHTKHFLTCLSISAKLIQNCFWDICFNGNVASPGPRWDRYTPRKILHFTTDHILEVAENLRDRPGHAWTTDTFLNILGTTCHDRGSRTDESLPIVWKTDRRDLVRWERMCPMLVNILSPSNLPTATVRQASQIRKLSNLTIPKKDNFFKDIMVHPLSAGHEKVFNIQVNQILMARIMVYKNLHERKKDIYTMNENDMLRLTIDETKDFSRFFDDKNKRQNAIQQTQKLLRPSAVDGLLDARGNAIILAAEINQAKWGIRGKGDLILTTYDDAIELHMHTLLENEDKSDAMRYAQKGNITIEFLDWLLTKKEEYNRWRTRKLDHSFQTLRDMMGIFDAKPD
jgi:hypothetical protein